MDQYADQVILLATDVEVGIGCNWVVDLDVEELSILFDNLKALVVDQEDL